MNRCTWLILAMVLLTFVSCQSNQRNADYPPESQLNSIYQDILNSLDHEYPGRGIDRFDEKMKDRPMAYGLITSAEANRYVVTKDSSALALTRTCGSWLLKNPDLDNDGIWGYGLADSSDAFGDGTPNPPFQEYTITTALALKGLLDWYQIESDSAIKESILNTSLKCIDPFLSGEYNAPSGMPMYSTNENDRQYDVINSSACIAGQMQRLSLLINDPGLARNISTASSNIIRVISNHVIVDNDGAINWMYGLQSTFKNDLLHVSYIIEGLRDYKEAGGYMELPWNQVISYLDKFNTRGIWYETTKWWHHYSKRNRPRLWSFGMLLYTLSKEKQYDRISKFVLPQLTDYKTENKRFKYKENDSRIMVRQEAHLLLGLSHYLYRPS